MLLDPARKRALWDRIVGGGIYFAADLAARLPEEVILTLAEPGLRHGVTWGEGVDFLLKTIRLLHQDWFSLHPNVRKRFVENIFSHLMIQAAPKRVQSCEILGDYPLIMVVSPTMRCNYHCKGCYSYHYRKRDAISTERLDRLYQEAKELGIHFVVLTGGEPYVREDTLDLFAAHPDIYFLTYTNGSYIADRDLAPRLAELGNVMPCVSVEGFEAQTDARRGPGAHRKIRKAMRDMEAAGMLFGFSATPMRHNNDLLSSDRFLEYYLELGCKVGFYFNYIPLGRSPDLDLMPTPEQRLHRYRRVREMRAKYNVLAADFWCDGMLTGGCLSGGRTYFHVNADGGVEPCVFHQFSVDNINEKPLVECLNSDYFRDIRSGLREVENPLRPCPIIDNPSMLREWVARHGARPSQPGGEAILDGPLAAGLDRYAAELKKVFDPVFRSLRAQYPWPLEPLGTMAQKRLSQAPTSQA